MKTLVLVRHGKAQKTEIGKEDFTRKLHERGIEEVTLMAKRLKKQNLYFDYWLSSPANRAFQTAKLFADTFDIKLEEINLQEKIYEAHTSDLLELINKIPDKYCNAIFFGHNPSFTDIVDYLCNKDIGHLPTGGVVQIEFPLDSWELISKNTGELKAFDYIKNN